MPSPTSAGRRQLRAPHEAQVAGAGPERLRRVPEAQAGVEVVGLKGLVVVDGVVATGCVGAVHPNLCRERREKVENLNAGASLPSGAGKGIATSGVLVLAGIFQV